MSSKLAARGGARDHHVEVAHQDGAGASAEAIETALAMFAHEVRTPLTGILAVADLLATSDLNARERRWVRTVKDAADHLTRLTTLFVDGARQRGAVTDRGREHFNIHELAMKVGQSFGVRAAAKGLQALVDVDPQLPRAVTGEPVRIRAALENLIDNAVKFTDAGNIVMKVYARDQGDGQVRIVFRLSDSGIGLTQAEASRLFTPFSQANLSIAARFGGAGLGLSMVRQLARSMGGDVVVRSREGGGAVFVMSFVMARAADGEAEPDALPVPVAAAQRLRILSVEDNPFVRVVLNAVLAEFGHTVQFISRGEDAVERLQQHAYDVVLMDMVLPGQSGVETIRAIRACDQPLAMIPVIGISGRGNDERKARAAGADAFLVKPVSPRALAAALAQVTRLPAIETL